MQIRAKPAKKLAVVRGSIISEITTIRTKITSRMFTIFFIMIFFRLINSFKLCEVKKEIQAKRTN